LRRPVELKLSTLLYHALRREELCKLKVSDFRHARRGVPHLKVDGKGEKTRFLPLHPGTNALIHDYLDAAGHGEDDNGALFRPIKNNRSKTLEHALTPDAVYKLVKAYSTELGFEIGAHALRATAATNALDHQLRQCKSARPIQCADEPLNNAASGVETGNLLPLRQEPEKNTVTLAASQSGFACTISSSASTSRPSAVDFPSALLIRSRNLLSPALNSSGKAKRRRLRASASANVARSRSVVQPATRLQPATTAFSTVIVLSRSATSLRSASPGK
jgi:Phage integrase family